MKQLRNLLVGLVVLGFLARLYLAWILPIWGDEAYSIWAISLPWVRLFNNTADPVHPPGYYLVLKVWGLASTHLLWLRFSSLLGYVLNCFLLWLIFAKRSKAYLLSIFFLYCFSGYFVIFDWQVRMYTLSLTFMLLIWYLLDQKKRWYWVTSTVFMGLFFDYTVAWFIAPLCLFLIAYDVVKHKKLSEQTAAVIGGGVLFGFWLITHPRLFGKGIGGIGWMKPYLNPFFHIPYFLGTHQSFIAFILALISVATGYWVLLSKKTDRLLLSVIFSASVCYTATLLISILVPNTIIFHLRSLQNVSLALLLCAATGLSFFGEKVLKKRQEPFKKFGYGLLVLLIITVQVTLFWKVVKLHTSASVDSKLILHFMPWKEMLEKLDPNKKWYLVIGPEKFMPPTPLIMWSLRYTAAGKETLNAPVIDFKKEKGKGDECRLIAANFHDLTACVDRTN